MKSISLSDEMEERGIALLTEFRAVLKNMIGEPQHEYQLNCVLQSNDGPTFDLRGENAIVYVGPNAMQYEPTFFANLAHESATCTLPMAPVETQAGLKKVSRRILNY